MWAGPEKNDHLDGPPLIVTRTDGATPFRLDAHRRCGPHAGRTGMGKSVLLATLGCNFAAIAARASSFDMGRSMRAAILGSGGEHYDLGTDGEIAFPTTRASTVRAIARGRRMDEGRLVQRRGGRPRREET